MSNHPNRHLIEKARFSINSDKGIRGFCQSGKKYRNFAYKPSQNRRN